MSSVSPIERIVLRLGVIYLEHGGKSVAVVSLSGRKSETFISRLWKAGLPALSILVEDGNFSTFSDHGPMNPGVCF